ncbi:MAG: conjugal transfer protein TraG N-terminal domain-containing protein, partial [Rickettsiaceae bacterium]|nr:conjugal transfer protein TraG N-terminal domain-containing protein [Rickettsiaceae bacterium]
ARHLGLGGMGKKSLLNGQLKSNIELAYGGTFGTKMSAEQIIQQNMMINAIHDYNNKADLYGYTRASMQQESSWMLGGKLASEYLPILLSVLKGLIYASFIFVVPFMIISGGMNRYLTYLTGVVSLQLWAPLNAILNLFIELYSGIIGSSITGGVLTYATFNESHGAIDKIVTVASGLQWAIPLLAYSVAKGGSHAFINLASNIGSTSQGAASMAASEVTTGSRSLDNISIGNMQRAQQIAHKTDLNSSYAADSSSYQHMDGTTEKVTAGGQTVLTSGAGQTVSSGSARFGIDQSKINQMNEGFSKSQSLVESDQLSYNTAKSATLAKTSNLVSNLAQREAAGHTHNYESMGEQGKALQQAVNHAKELHDQNNYGWEQAAGTSVKAYVDAGVKVPEAVPFVKGSAGVAVDATLTANNTSNQSLSEDERISRSNDASKNFNNMVRAASNENWMKENSVDTSYAQDVRGSHEEMQSFGRNLSMHQEQAAAYSKAANVLDSMGSSSNHEMYHVVEERLMQDHNVSQQDAHKMIEQQDPRAARAWDNIVNEKVNSIAGPISTFKDSVSGPAANAKMHLFENAHAHKVNEGTMQYVDQAAFEQGLDRNKMQRNITNKGDELQQTGKQMQQENTQKREIVEGNNNTLEKGLQKRADKYEEDRIGQGRIGAPIAGGIANFVTAGNAGDVNVGGPNKAERMLKNYQGDQLKATNISNKKK